MMQQLEATSAPLFTRLFTFQSKEERYIGISLLLFIILNSLDVLTTIIALESGLEEQNPLMDWFIQNMGYNGMLILKLLGCIIAVAYLELIVKKLTSKEVYLKNMKYMLITGNLIAGLVVIGNLYMLGVMYV